MDLVKYAKLCNQSYNDIPTADGYNYLYTANIQIKETNLFMLFNETELTFVFRGTDSTEDVKLDLDICKASFIIEKNNKNLGRVHHGFLHYYLNVKQEMFDMVDYYTNLYPNGKIFCTGHSLGASINLFALDLYFSRDIIAKCITYGSPRLGNISIARNLDKYLPDSIRVFNPADQITTVPSVLLLYIHAGKPKQVGKSVLFQRTNNLLNIFKDIFSSKNIIETITDNILDNHSITRYIQLLEMEK